MKGAKEWSDEDNQPANEVGCGATRARHLRLSISGCLLQTKAHTEKKIETSTIMQLAVKYGEIKGLNYNLQD